MSSIIKINNLEKEIFIMLLTLLLGASVGFSQINTDKLKSKVEDKIGNYYTEPFEVSVDKAGVVTLKGEVGTLYDKLRIGELVSMVDGVKEVKNKILVKNDITANDIIKANIENELQRNDAIIEPEKIKVEVNNGVVTLSGSVNYFREKLMAQTIASWQDGVSEIVDHINVMSPSVSRSDANLTEIIHDILKKNFSLEKNVKFSINNGVVDLQGTVTSLYAKDHLPEDIQRVLGVKGVNNNLSVENYNE
jgi:osmotically-inducible protein OsmY